MDAFSFYCYWKSKNEDKPDPDQIEETLKSHFGTGRVNKCLNRVEALFIDSNLAGVLEKLQNPQENNIETWMLVEKCLGSLVNQINM